MQYIQLGDFEKEIVCNKKDTLSIENSIMEATKLHDCYLVCVSGDTAQQQTE